MATAECCYLFQVFSVIAVGGHIAPASPAEPCPSPEPTGDMAADSFLVQADPETSPTSYTPQWTFIKGLLVSISWYWGPLKGSWGVLDQHQVFCALKKKMRKCQPR